MKAIILAAGQSKRMKSSLRKTLHPLCGKPVITYITDACRAAGVDDMTIVVGVGDAETQQLFGEGVRFAVQERPRGTGHAVQAAFAGATHFADDDEILVLAGDMPLLTAEFLQALVQCHRAEADTVATVATVHWPQNTDFGHVYTDEGDHFLGNVEARDLTPNHTPTPLRGTSCYLFNGAALKYGLAKLTDHNAQNEFYLTDVPMHIKNNGQRVKIYRSHDDPALFTGINTQLQLAEAAKLMRARINAQHMLNGVKMIDPAATYIDAGVEIAAETTIYPGAVLEGKTVIEAGAFIGANVCLKNVHVGPCANIHASSVLMDARINASSNIGPFAFMRNNADIGSHCRIGSFVEIKNAVIGNHTNAAHLAYIGDATVGNHVNYGCGAITANYDGKNKSRTIIHDNAFIGSNTNLIAPMEVGEGAFIAAGSTIDSAVPSGSFAIARNRQYVKTHWENDPRKQPKK